MSAQQQHGLRRGPSTHDSGVRPDRVPLHGDDLPWSHRQPTVIRLIICILAGVAVGVVGTIAHRMGASMNIPYGLVLALVIVGLSTWCARSRAGVTGLALHLIFSSATAWAIAVYSPGGGTLTPIGFGGEVPFFSDHVGYMWLIGMIVVQIMLLLCPSRWFAVAPQTGQRRS